MCIVNLIDRTYYFSSHVSCQIALTTYTLLIVSKELTSKPFRFGLHNTMSNVNGQCMEEWCDSTSSNLFFNIPSHCVALQSTYVVKSSKHIS